MKALKIIGVLLLLLTAFGIGENAFVYYDHGGARVGNLTSLVSVALAYVAGIGLCLFGAFKLATWKA